VLDAELMIGSQ